jgi:hypothetical protein
VTARRVGVLVALLAVGSLAGCAALGTAPATTYGPGETVELQGETTTYAVTVEEYRLTGSYEAARGVGGDRTVTAPDGQQYLYLKMSVENVGDHPGDPPGVSVRPSTDVLAGPRPAWADAPDYESGLFADPVAPGESRTGWVGVRVPEDATAEDVRVALSTAMVPPDDDFRWVLGR